MTNFHPAFLILPYDRRLDHFPRNLAAIPKTRRHVMKLNLHHQHIHSYLSSCDNNNPHSQL
ncbi:hypothetical protein BJ165DRAFT_1514289 [Panaeolus papilionaceus]|nr:hypothetical protein BJ165DRAFT_1514289 [Panaeolus papilionaceus]